MDIFVTIKSFKVLIEEKNKHTTTVSMPMTQEGLQTLLISVLISGCTVDRPAPQMTLCTVASWRMPTLSTRVHKTAGQCSWQEQAMDCLSVLCLSQHFCPSQPACLLLICPHFFHLYPHTKTSSLKRYWSSQLPTPSL